MNVVETSAAAAVADAAQDEHLSTEHLQRDLKGRSVSGGIVTIAAQGAKFVLTLGSGMIMARLVAPRDYGLVAMVSSAIALLSIFKDAGLSTATVQRDNITQAQVSNLFWLNLAVSGLVAVLVAALAPVISWFYDKPHLTSITLLLSLTFILNGAAVQHMALLNRQMRFKAIAVVEIGSLVASIIVGIVMAKLGFRYWALVGAAVTLEAVALILTWLASGWHPHWPMRRSGTLALIRFGANLTGANFFLSLVGGLDSILVGKFYGDNALGFYSRANSLLMRPINQFVTPISAVFLPALSRLQSQPERYRRSFMQIYESMALISFPLTALFLALSRPLTLVLLGPKWEEAARIFGGFTFAALYLPFAMACRWLFTTQGRGRDMLVTNSIVAGVTVISIFAGLPFGPLGVAVAFSLSGCLIRLPILYHFSGKSGPVSSADLWAGLLRQLPLWVVVFGATYAVRLGLTNFRPLLQVLVCAPLGLLTAVVFTASFASHRRVAIPLLQIVAEQRRAKAVLRWVRQQGSNFRWRLEQYQKASLRRPAPRFSLEEAKARLNPAKVDLKAVSLLDVSHICRMDPIQLLTEKRFDLAAKHIYARFWANGLHSDWGRDVYDQHIKAFNDYDEDDGSGKRGLDSFLEAYRAILESVRKNGFDDSQTIVPITKSNFPIDGGHRVAACLFYQQPVTVIKIASPHYDWNYSLFQRRGMPEKHMDAMALEFCRLKKNAYLVLHFPSAVGRDADTERILEKYARIFYRKNVHLNRQGSLNLMRQIYETEPWVGDFGDAFAGAQRKADGCFAAPGPMRVYVCEADSLEHIKQAKQKIRDCYGIENHSVHINDTQVQAVQMAQIVLNSNSIHFLCHANLEAFPAFNKHLKLYRRWLARAQCDSERFCVDGSATLAAYGIRDADDLDFLHFGEEGISTGIPNINSHNGEIHHHVLAKDDIIFNPDHHFYYYGTKFVSLNALRAMKLNRGEPKDKHDVGKIDEHLSAAPEPS